MKNIVLICSTLLSAFLSVSQAAPDKTIDRIVAVVNDEVITASELHHQVSIIKASTDPQELAAYSKQDLNKKVLNQMIDKKIQLQLAKQANITLDEKEVDKAIANIAKQNQATLEELQEKIAQTGMSMNDYRNNMREQLTIRRVQQQEVLSHIAVSTEEIERYIRSHVQTTNEAKEYKIEDVFVPLPDSPTNEQVVAATKLVDTVKINLQKNKTFDDIAKSVPTLRNNRFGWMKLPDVPSAFVEHVQQMRIKDIAGPIQTSNGLHVIRLSAVRGAGAKKSLISASEAHNILMERKFEEAMQTWMAKLHDQAIVSVKL